MPLPDFPNNIMEFQQRFASEDAYWDYLVQLRWPEGFVCPYCEAPAATFIESRSLWECQNGHQVSVTTETVMHRSHVPLTKWFWAAYLVTTQTPGLSGKVLERQIGVSYETAYMMLQRLRAGMVDPDRTKLAGTVEVDEGFVSAGQVRETRRGRGTGKPIVVAAVEFQGRYAGRVRLRRIEDASEEELIGFIQENIEPGSTVVTDGWMSYHNVSDYGYNHTIREGEDSVDVAEQLPHVHRVFGNLKQWLLGTHHGVSAKHLQAYLNEYVFRFNRRGNPMASFRSVLGIASHVEGPEYEQLYSAGEEEGWSHPNPGGG